MTEIPALPPSYDVPLGPRVRHFLRNNILFVAGLAILGVVIVLAVLAPLVAPYDPVAIDFSRKLKGPGLEHLMGTDALGRDIFSRVVYGARSSLFIGFTVLFFSMAIGVPIGLVAGYFGGRTDTILMRFSDVFLAFPPLLLPIAITAMLGAGLFNAMLALAISWFPWYARIIRGSVMSVRRELYIDAARAMEVSPARIMWRHALPNSWDAGDRPGLNGFRLCDPGRRLAQLHRHRRQTADHRVGPDGGGVALQVPRLLVDRGRSRPGDLSHGAGREPGRRRCA